MADQRKSFYARKPQDRSLSTVLTWHSYYIRYGYYHEVHLYAGNLLLIENNDDFQPTPRARSERADERIRARFVRQQINVRASRHLLTEFTSCRLCFNFPVTNLPTLPYATKVTNMPCDTCYLGHFARRYRWQQSLALWHHPIWLLKQVSSRSGQIFKSMFLHKSTCFSLRISSGFQICH